MFDLETGISPFDDEAKVAIFRVLVEEDEVFLEIEPRAAGTDPCAADCKSGES